MRREQTAAIVDRELAEYSEIAQQYRLSGEVETEWHDTEEAVLEAYKTLTVERSKWLRGEASHLIGADGCGCVIGHYLIAKGVPRDILQYHYGFVKELELFAETFLELGEFEDDEGEPYFRPSPECDMIIGVNDGDPRSIHNQYVAPVNNDKQREIVLIRLMKEIGCRLRFV